jgi:hypothetical protein
LALLTLCFGVTASADVTWTLNDVVFNDGGQAVGSFTLNSSGDPVSWDIAVSGGDTAAYPAVTFTTGEPTDFKGASQPEFANAPFTLYLVLGTLAPLTNAGGIVDLDPNNALDCNNGPCRVMTSAGFLSSGAAPEPVSVALAGVGLMCVALRRRLIK